MNDNEYERNRDDRNLRLSLAEDDSRYDRRGLSKLPARGGPLPPEVLLNWDQINAGKHDGSKPSPHSDPEQLKKAYHQAQYDYDDFKARRHIRQHEESRDSVRSVGNIRDYSQGSKNYLVGENYQYEKSIQSRDSVKHNAELSSKKSDVLNSDENSGMMSTGNERSLDDKKKIPPIPLSRETSSVPDDNPGFQGNHMQTEKEAFAEEVAETKSEGKVMVKGQVKQVKADIDQGPNPEKTYKRVEDFFQTQRESSIVEVPNAVKKEEASKLFKDNFIPVKDGSDQVNKEQGKNNFPL